MKTGFPILIFCLMILLFPGLVFSQNNDEPVVDPEFDFQIDQVKKKPYSINADIETKQTLKLFNQDALLFKQKYLDNQNHDAGWQTDLDATIEGKFQTGPFQFHGRFNSVFTYTDDDNWVSQRKVEEGIVSFQPFFSLAVEAGKKVHKWGKGYAFNPSAFFSRPKDLDDPDATLEGYYSFSADIIKSMDGMIQTIAFTPVFMPVTRDLNHELGEKDELIWGGKIYFFTFDTDVDLMFLFSDNMDDRVGVDFSKNLTPSFEIHGDAAFVKNFHQSYIDENGNTGVREYSAFNFLLGLRYLSTQDTTYILEYYRNEEGYSAREYESYLGFVAQGYEEYLMTGSRTSLSKSKSYTRYYNKQAALKDYLYLKISQKDPFTILNFIPAITLIYNLQDQSASVTPQFKYSPVTNFTMELKTGFFLGPGRSEYGEKLNKARIVLSLKHYF